jgi:hypothetical protein
MSLISSESVGNVSQVRSVEPGPGFIGPEPADVPSRLRFDMGMERDEREGSNFRRSPSISLDSLDAPRLLSRDAR